MTNEVTQFDCEVAAKVWLEPQSNPRFDQCADILEGRNNSDRGVQTAKHARIRMEREVVQPLRDELAQASEREKALQARVAELQAVVMAAHQLVTVALPQFDWGKSALDAEAIGLLTSVPIAIAQALAGGRDDTQPQP